MIIQTYKLKKTNQPGHFKVSHGPYSSRISNRNTARRMLAVVKRSRWQERDLFGNLWAIPTERKWPIYRHYGYRQNLIPF